MRNDRKPRTILLIVRTDTGSHDRLAVKLIDGKVVRFSFDELSAFMVFERVPWYRDSAWLLPMTCAGLAALLLTGVMWPIAAIVRRRYGATLPLDPNTRRLVDHVITWAIEAYYGVR